MKKNFKKKMHQKVPVVKLFFIWKKQKPCVRTRKLPTDILSNMRVSKQAGDPVEACDCHIGHWVQTQWWEKTAE